jgi:hypothetical protein
MKTLSTFSSVGWDFANMWAICEGTNYPRLRWQIPAGDFVCPDGVDFGDYSFFAARYLDVNCENNNNCNGADLDVSGTVDWKDMMLFCQHWLEGVNVVSIPKNGDINGDGKADSGDLMILADQWLQPPGDPSADIAPVPDGDGIVDFFDFAELARHGLEGAI